MTGLELDQRLMPINPAVPVIIGSGFSDMLDEAKAKAVRIKEYIKEPIQTRDLATVVRSVLDNANGTQHRNSATLPK